MKFKHILSLSFILIFFPDMQGKTTEKDSYVIVNDTITHYGMDLRLGPMESRAYEVTQKAKSTSDNIIYTPDKIKGFKIKNGSLYMSHEIDIDGKKDKVFLEELEKNDSLTIWYCKKNGKDHFFIDRYNGDLVSMTKENNPYKNWIPSSEKYSRSNIHKNIKAAQNSSLNYFTRFRYGIMLFSGMGLLNMDKSDQQYSDYYLSGGIFFDIPIQPVELSIHPELYYIKERRKFDLYPFPIYFKNNFITNYHTIELSALVRYSFLSVKGSYIPFISLGPTIGRVITGKSKHSYMTLSERNVSPIIEYTKTSHCFTYGFTIGAGIEKKLTKSNSIFVDIRYQSLWGHENLYISNNIYYNTQRLLVALSFNI